MDCHVTVIAKEGESHEFHLTEAELAMFSADSARTWLAREFEAEGCEPINPVGKVLLVDQILLVGRTRPAGAWSQPLTQWMKQYLCAAACALGRPALTIDLARHSL